MLDVFLIFSFLLFLYRQLLWSRIWIKWLCLYIFFEESILSRISLSSPKWCYMCWYSFWSSPYAGSGLGRWKCKNFEFLTTTWFHEILNHEFRIFTIMPTLNQSVSGFFIVCCSEFRIGNSWSHAMSSTNIFRDLSEILILSPKIKTFLILLNKYHEHNMYISPFFPHRFQYTICRKIQISRHIFPRLETENIRISCGKSNGLKTIWMAIWISIPFPVTVG